MCLPPNIRFQSPQAIPSHECPLLQAEEQHLLLFICCFCYNCFYISLTIENTHQSWTEHANMIRPSEIRRPT